MKKITVYDNGGRTLDRYTVFKGDNVYTMSKDPLFPLGVNQYIGTRKQMLGMRLGRKVPVNKLPSDVRKAIKSR